MRAVVWTMPLSLDGFNMIEVVYTQQLDDVQGSDKERMWCVLCPVFYVAVCSVGADGLRPDEKVGHCWECNLFSGPVIC